MIELYDHPVSPCAQKVRLVLAEKAISYEIRPVDLGAKQNLTPEYLQLNPAGLVPTLVVDGQPIPESTVICELLDELYPNPSLRPDEPLQQAQNHPDIGERETIAGQPLATLQRRFHIDNKLPVGVDSGNRHRRSHALSVELLLALAPHRIRHLRE